ncbi:MAG: hypothetical protein II920_04825 [Clostridia bacterium]|nr:hypothetical protein [Clostridia bacterium]
MTLPGKITLCELEEDNPQRSYFRVRPLMTIEEGGMRDVRTEQSLFPDEGGIRIVPDKNEAMRFKNRMRTLGGYCLMDLTRHPNENEKIRPNKNYSPERGELNRCIVYSDVICAVGEYDVMQVLSSKDAGKNKVAYTPRVLLREGDELKGSYVPDLTPDKVIYGFIRDTMREPFSADESRVFIFERGGEQVELYISEGLEKLFNEERAQAASQRQPEQAAAEAPAGEGSADAHTEGAPEAQHSAQENEKEAAKPEAESAPEAPRSEPAPEKPAAKPAAKPRETRPAEPANEDRRFEERRSRRELFEGQVGLNPRHSKTLSEVVDSHWRQSRIEKLGADVAGDGHSEPVISPIERATKALNEAWRLPEARSALIKEMNKLEDLPEAFVHVSEDRIVPKDSYQREMNNLEAERLELLREIDKLKNDRARQRGELMEETRAAHAREIAELEMREQRLKDECVSRQRAAQSARQAQLEAEKLMTQESKAKLDSEFLKFAMFTKAAALLKNEESFNVNSAMGIPQASDMTGAQMISDLRRAFEEGGRELDNNEALNLLACMAIGSIVIFSGPTGCGKSFTAHALAGAMGLMQKNAYRFARLDCDSDDAKKCIGFAEQLKCDDMMTQRLMLLEDINMKRVPDQSRGLLAFADEAKRDGITLMMTCLDDQVGYPLQPRLLDRAFFIRLKLPEWNGWQLSKRVPLADVAPSLESVKKVFLTPGEIPTEIRDRMDTLVNRLKEVDLRITPRALDDMYMYCAAVCPLMTGDKIEALDRAVAQRALPHILATAKASQLAHLPEILCDMPLSLSLLNEPIALPPI